MPDGSNVPSCGAYPPCFAALCRKCDEFVSSPNALLPSAAPRVPMVGSAWGTTDGARGISRLQEVTSADTGRGCGHCLCREAADWANRILGTQWRLAVHTDAIGALL